MTSIFQLNSEQDHDGHAIVGQRVGAGGENIVVVTFAPESNLAGSLADRLKGASSLFPFVQALTFGGFLPAEDDGEAQAEGDAQVEGEAAEGEAKPEGEDPSAAEQAPELDEQPIAYAVLVNGEVVLSFLYCKNIIVTPAIAEQGDDLSGYERFIFGLSDDEVVAASEALKFGLGTAAGDDELYFLLTGEPVAEETEVEAVVEPEAAEGAQAVEEAGVTEAEAGDGAAVEGYAATVEGEADGAEAEDDETEDAGEKQAKAKFGGVADGVYNDASFEHEGTVVYVIAIGELKD